jgi:hypothetical protein
MQRIALWDAINRVVVASGGDPGNTSVARQRAVVEVERIVAEIEAEIPMLLEALDRIQRVSDYTITSHAARDRIAAWIGDVARAALRGDKRVLRNLYDEMDCRVLSGPAPGADRS